MNEKQYLELATLYFQNLDDSPYRSVEEQYHAGCSLLTCFAACSLS